MKKILLAVFLITALVACKDDKFPGNPGPGFRRGPAPADADGPKDPWANSNANISCLWCGEPIDKKSSPKIKLDNFPWENPSLRHDDNFCGLKCYNEFKSTYFKNRKEDYKFNDSTKTYTIVLSAK
jgi:hypothetical protein